MKHRAFTLIEAVVILTIMIILAAILYPIFMATDRAPRRSRCQSNLKQIGLAFMQYASDYSETLPAVAASSGWARALQPYAKNWQIFHCPSVQPPSAAQTIDYFINSRAANVKWEKFEDRGVSILAGDGVPAQTTQAILSALPAAWRKFGACPAQRHDDGAVYLFADGHAKWLRPEKITLDKPSGGKPTFLVQ